MMRVFERAVFLRTLNYLRITHAYSVWYNWVYPLVIGGTISFLLARPDSAINLFSGESLIGSFAPVLSVLCPFYIAALAAVATFSGPKSIDKPFEMSRPVLLEVLGVGGGWESIDVTPRHFLSLLFGYCTTLSILLLGISIFAKVIGSGILRFSGDWGGVVLAIIAFLFFVLLSQLVVNTLLGVYYLSDKLHRRF